MIYYSITLVWCASQVDLMSPRVLALPWCIKLQEHKTSVAVWSQRSSFWRNFTKGVPSSIKTRKRPGRRVVSVNPTPSLPPCSSTGTRAGGSVDVTITLTHARADSLSHSPSLAFLFWEATLGITPSAPPSRSGQTHFHLFLKQRRTTLYSNTWCLQHCLCITIRVELIFCVSQSWERQWRLTLFWNVVGGFENILPVSSSLVHLVLRMSGSAILLKARLSENELRMGLLRLLGHVGNTPFAWLEIVNIA